MLHEKTKQLNFDQEDGYSSIETLNLMMTDYENWFSASMGKFKTSTPEEDVVREKIEKVKTRKVGAKRQD